MKPKSNLQLRKIGQQYLIVEASAERVNMSNVYTLNETAAGIWQQLVAGRTAVADLAAWLCSVYDVTPEQAQADVQRQLDEWQSCGLIE